MWEDEEGLGDAARPVGERGASNRGGVLGTVARVLTLCLEEGGGKGERERNELVSTIQCCSQFHIRTIAECRISNFCDPSTLVKACCWNRNKEGGKSCSNYSSF